MTFALPFDATLTENLLLKLKLHRGRSGYPPHRRRPPGPSLDAPWRPRFETVFAEDILL